MRRGLWLSMLVSSLSLAQPRVAVHPLQVSGLPAQVRETLEATFAVKLARIDAVRLAGTGAVDDALAQPSGKQCDVRDACLRFLAEQTGSLYAMHARVGSDALVTQLSASARVVRSDGVVVRSVERQTAAGTDAVKAGRDLVATLIEALELGALPVTVPVFEPGQGGATAGVMSTTPGDGGRKVWGAITLGAGGATMAAGGVLAVLAATGRNRLTPDANGAVPREQAGLAATVAQEAKAATVLIPVGAVAAAAGVTLLLWKPEAEVMVSAAPSPTGGVVMLSGRLPK